MKIGLILNMWHGRIQPTDPPRVSEVKSGFVLLNPTSIEDIKLIIKYGGPQHDRLIRHPDEFTEYTSELMYCNDLTRLSVTVGVADAP